MDKIYSRKRLIIPKLDTAIFYKFKKGNNKEPRNMYKACKIFIIIFIAIITATKMIEAIDPIIEKQCKVSAKSIATRISNEQATLVMSKYSYDDLCNVKKDANGNIAMISANVITVNEIISDVAVKIQEELNKEKNNSFNIRLGSLTGTKILAGRGPNINVKIEIAGNLDTDLRSEFETEGINQTLHKIYLQVECDVVVLTPFNTIEEKIVNQVLLAEAVIIGTTPQTYFDLN